MINKELQHPFSPIYNKESKILILGTFPSVKSRENAFYYGHRQNRFWPLLSLLFNEETPKTIEEKTAFLLKNRIALWDVLAGCTIEGSADSTIKNTLPNEILPLLEVTKIKAIFTNGKKAKELYDKYLLTKTEIEATALPSTSPANGHYTMERLKNHWQIIVKD